MKGTSVLVTSEPVFVQLMFDLVTSLPSAQAEELCDLLRLRPEETTLYLAVSMATDEVPTIEVVVEE
jgi:hypothetical protein